MTVSLPYEPGRAAFASLRRTQEDLAALAGGRIEEFPARAAEYGHEALAHLERHLFADSPPAGPALDGAIRFFEAAGVARVAGARLGGDPGARGERNAARGDRARRPSVERWRASLETVLGTLGIPVAIEGRIRLGQTAVRAGAARAAPLRVAAGRPPRPLRLPPLAVLRLHPLERRLSRRQAARPRRLDAGGGRGGDDQASRRAAAAAARGAPQRGRAGRGRPCGRGRDAARRARPRGAAGGRGEPADLRAYDAIARLLDELDGWRALGGELTADEVLARSSTPRCGSGRPASAGRVAVSTSHAPAPAASTPSSCSASRRGRCRAAATPPRSSTTTLRGELDRDAHARLVRPTPVERERYLFYTACTRATRRLTLVREAATDEGSPREPSPFWDEVAALFDPDDVRRWTRRRPLSQLTWELEEAPTERERLRALALLAVTELDGAQALARRERLGAAARARARARSRARRSSRTRACSGELSAKTPFNVTELERFADCSSAWFFERLISPRQIDRRVDAMLRGSVAHTTLHRFYAGLPRAIGSDTRRREPPRRRAARFSASAWTARSAA